ncbi:IS5 family transposase [Morganella morganii]|uniref:IS5 family transposase n=1 Tax=Morganella morganii TaxID=582 RepID=UPI000F82C359|nr:IS5 family transposase [Morganella morganii]MBT0445342.1 IS5 family transposase [Morganella morganii subsp. morganii]RTY19739.1 IS5 family transposase [Morganella morganii subsp. morganii]
MPSISQYSSRKSRFLDRMNVMVPWPEIVDMLRPWYPSSSRGRKPFPLMLMLRIHCLQLWFDLSDGAAEDALHDVLPFRQFTGIRDCVPDRTTIMNFRHFLEKHNAGEQILALINGKLKQAGLLLRQGIIIDATIIAAPCSVKNKSGQRDPEMHQTRKGNQWYFGMKAHIAVDAATGLTEKVVTTSANEHDLNQAENLITEPVECVFADAGYRGAEKRGSLSERVKNWFIAKGPHALKQLRAHPRRHKQALHDEYVKASIRAKVEHPFRILKCQFGFSKTRLRGLLKNHNRLSMLFAMGNLLRASQLAGIA